ncbi:DUF3828 domain-containing protein [Herbaspirillum sp. YR522]|uniref:DUF3828 domain-containing protein n=1 Tax=Herbaspirillum sp. YR522 TaxID=1144342 RepID=UPI00026F7F15|nr:DUF3828 domain-containing protein [Herbaspirillum sp. YR522]EJN10054.1 hypothetical protein PMI40_00317 [Herbaspirillum sp. YR522]
MNNPSAPAAAGHCGWPSSTPRRRAVVACALLAALALGGCHDFSGDEQRQADVVDNFYRIHLKANAPGLPASDELRQLQPLVSPALNTLLTQAEAAENRYHGLAGNQAPPLVEGDLMTSLYEGATSFSVQSCETDEQCASCQVQFRYRKDGSDEAWNDKVLLVQHERQWRIDDIEFIGLDQSSHREYLSDALADAIAQVD